MKTSFVIPGIPKELCRDADDPVLVAAGVDQRISRAREQFHRGRMPFRPDSQPRDSRGRFRQVLARLKFDLGGKQLENIVQEIENAEHADDVGDITKAGESAKNVIKLVDDIDAGVLDPEAIKNVRTGTAELGRVLAYLPLPQGDPNAKVRFSDLPPSTQKLVEGMIDRVVDKLGPEDASKAIEILQSFMSGVRSMASDEMSAELNKLLRLLT